jgi:AraC-like DNA-binding protein
MSSVLRQPPDIDADWLLRATQHDYQLAPDSPIYPAVSAYPHPTALNIDLHEAMEIGVVLHGRQQRQYSDFRLELSPGDVWLQPTWEPHGWRTVAPDTESLILIFLPEFLGEEKLGSISWLTLFAAPPRGRPWVREHDLRRRVLAVGREMAEEIARREAGWLTALRLGMLRLLLLLSRHWTPSKRSAEASGIGVTTLSRVMPAIALIRRRPSGLVSVAEAAETCGLSRSRFATLFRQTMGSSFGQFCIRARLGSAAHRLLTTDLPVEAVAQAAGFVDASHFHRTFVKHYGCTPRAYRTGESGTRSADL